MAGVRVWMKDLFLADLVTEVISAAGALVAPLAIKHAWTQIQYSPPYDFTGKGIGGEITFDFSTAGKGNTYKYDLDEAAATLMAPDNVLEGMRWSLLVIADGTNELTYEGGDSGGWDFGTETAPDFSAMSNGDRVLLDFYAPADQHVFIAASVVYAA